jgi:hypothetical protein
MKINDLIKILENYNKEYPDFEVKKLDGEWIDRDIEEDLIEINKIDKVIRI